MLNFKEFKLFEYSSDWNKEIFDNLPSFAARIRYCTERLQRISSGSSRVVYIIGDKVLKVAKNKKGLSQNENEYNLHNDSYTSGLAPVFDYHPDFYWIEMKLAKKVNFKRFEELTGMNFNNYVAVLSNDNIKNKKLNFPKRKKIADEDDILNNEFYFNIVDLIHNYNLTYGDLYRINSYGEIDNEIVLIDFGLDDETYNTFYKR
jgi:hypothetical protein